MKFYIWKKISLIEFNECGNYLKDNFGVNDILLLKININNENTIDNIVKYYIYDYYGNELDISLCNSISINVFSPIINYDLVDLMKQWK